MSNKYFSSRKGPYIYCEICGQACYTWELTKLSPHTGRGGLLVCKNDADAIDHGLVPYKVAEEQKVPFSRPNHTNLTNGSEPYDVETGNIF
jgi:hypothetical protein